MNLLQLDHQVFQLINHDFSNSFFDVILPYWTDFQRGPFFSFIVLPTVIVTIFLKARGKGIGVFALGLLFLSAVDFIFGRLLKDFIARPRPAISDLDFEVILRGPFFGGFSFPSSHALDAFFLAIFWSSFAPRLRWPLIFLASLTAYSRVYCGLHFPSDVLGGAALGSILGIGLAKLVQTLYIKIHKGQI